MKQQVGGNVHHQQLSGRAERTLGRSRQQHREQRPQPAGGGSVAQTGEVGGRVEQDQNEQIQGRNNDESQQVETH